MCQFEIVGGHRLPLPYSDGCGNRHELATVITDALMWPDPSDDSSPCLSTQRYCVTCRGSSLPIRSHQILVENQEIGIALSPPDERYLIFTQRGGVGSDLMLVKDFVPPR